ncbi:ATP-binding protein [Ramlibacter sp. PS3R-8]|uniref:ATP-binding protein n=1 Tax=Ramlibacter sp. PS3R-8 TaxID=3133437 RepID=UPI0030A7C59C
MKPPASLQGRLLLLVLSVSLAVWLATAAIAWRDASHELDELLDGHLAQSAALLAAQGVGADDDDEEVDAPVLHRYAPKVAFQVFHDQRLVLRSPNAPREPMVAGDASPSGFHDVRLQGQRWRVFAAHGAERDIQVFVGEQQRSRAEILVAVLRSGVWPVALGLPLLALALWWAVRRGVRPLRTLGEAVARRHGSDLQPLQLGDAPSEIRPLVAALDQLFGRIAGLLERERRFSADAAHELRTPIAAIRAQAQVALGAVEESQRRHALEATLAGCDRATRLVEQLLMLSRLEAAQAPILRPVDLAAVARRVMAELAPASLARQQSMSLAAGPRAVVAGDEPLLAALVRNLVDNAVRYAPCGARIEVRIDSDGAGVMLCVEDSGPGLAAGELERLGQRFFRAAGQEMAGSGLGWSIVQRIVQAHGGRLAADRSPLLGGLRVTAHFPGGHDAAVRK